MKRLLVLAQSAYTNGQQNNNHKIDPKTLIPFDEDENIVSLKHSSK
jgi:hypothetical protein